MGCSSSTPRPPTHDNQDVPQPSPRHHSGEACAVGNPLTVFHPTWTPPESREEPTELLALLAVAGNDACAECTAAGPTWAAIRDDAGARWGVFVCGQCAGVHRDNVSQRVRSLHNDKWAGDGVAFMRDAGNTAAARDFPVPTEPPRPLPTALRTEREASIRRRYGRPAAALAALGAGTEAAGGEEAAAPAATSDAAGVGAGGGDGDGAAGAGDSGAGAGVGSAGDGDGEDTAAGDGDGTGAGAAAGADADAQPAGKGRLMVICLRANDLQNMDVLDVSDPYCVVTLGGVTARSKVIPNNLSPTWNEPLGMFPWDGAELMRVQVLDHDALSADDDNGHATVSLHGIPPMAEQEVTVPLRGVVSGSVTLLLNFFADDSWL